MPPSWSVYLVRCADGSLYTGIAVNVERRLAEHRAGGARAARYLRGRGPLELAFSRDVGSRSSALRIERRLKRIPKRRKEALVDGTGSLDTLLAGLTGQAEA